MLSDVFGTGKTGEKAQAGRVQAGNGVDIEHAGLHHVGDAELYRPPARGLRAPMKEAHFAEAHIESQQHLQNVLAGKTGLVPGDHVQHEHFRVDTRFPAHGGLRSLAVVGDDSARRVPVSFLAAGANRWRGQSADNDYPVANAYVHQLAASFAASSTSTLTSRETPGSCMVTPIRQSTISMVILLWVMIMNCNCSDISLTMRA